MLIILCQTQWSSVTSQHYKEDVMCPRSLATPPQPFQYYPLETSSSFGNPVRWYNLQAFGTVTFGRSFMKMMKRRGSSTLSWGCHWLQVPSLTSIHFHLHTAFFLVEPHWSTLRLCLLCHMHLAPWAAYSDGPCQKLLQSPDTLHSLRQPSLVCETIHLIQLDFNWWNRISNNENIVCRAIKVTIVSSILWDWKN